MRKFIYLMLPFIVCAACNLSKTMLVTPGKQNISADGGLFVLNLTVASDESNWSAECDSAWVDVLQKHGKGDATITVKVQANPRSVARSAIIKIKDSESLVQVAVLQEANRGNNGGGNGGENGGNGGEYPPAESNDAVFNGVVFAPGNLQYNPAKDEWRFAANPWDYIEDDNRFIAATYDGWIDLFGWGTSGYMACYPYLTSLSDSEYGPAGEQDITDSEANYDWGVYNSSKITNNPNTSYKWRLLSSVEWMHIKDKYLYTLANIEDYPGLLIFANQEDAKEFELSETDFYAVTIDADWLASHAVVFLPAAGIREGTVYDRKILGKYHTSTCHPDEGCVFWEFEEVAKGDYVGCAYTIGEVSGRHFGASVRLVRDVNSN